MQDILLFLVCGSETLYMCGVRLIKISKIACIHIRTERRDAIEQDVRSWKVTDSQIREPYV